MTSFRNRQLPSMCQRRLVSTKSHKLAITTSSTMIEKCNQSSMFCLPRHVSKLSSRLKKKLSWKRSENSRQSIKRDRIPTLNHGNRRSDVKTTASSRRIKRLTMQGQSENSRLRQCTSFNAWIYRRTSCKAASWALWPSSQNNHSGEIRSRINCQLHSRISYSVTF